jgi:hypothetical protein
MAEAKSAAEIFLDVAVNFEKKTHEQDKFAYGIAQKTKLVIRISVVFLTAFTVFTAFSIYSLSEVLEEAVTHMETMYHNFGKVSEEMSAMAASVTNTEKNVSDVSAIAEVVSSMHKSVAGIEQDMTLMDTEMIRFKVDIQRIQQDMGDMSKIFDHVNQSMGRIRYDVGEISRTASIIPAP